MMTTMVPSARRNNNKHVVLVVAAISLFYTLMPTMISSFVPLMTTSRAQRQQSQPPSMPDSIVETTLSGRRSSRRNKNRAPHSSESGEVEILVEREVVEEVQEVEEEEETEVDLEVELEQFQRREEQVEIEEIVSTTTIAEEKDVSVSVEDEEQLLIDESHMRLAIEYAKSQTNDGAYPNPTVGAVLISSDGQVLGLGRSTYAKDAIQDVLEQSGLDITPLREWCVTWPSQSSATWKLRDDLASATLYVTLEPISGRRGESLPPITQLIELSGVSRIVIGAPDPVPERAGNGAQALHRQSGCDVSMGRILTEECVTLISPYIERVNSKFHIMARNHRRRHGRPLGLLHCSVVDSDNIEAFAQMGNAFGTSFGGKTLSFRDFGSYEMAPPPEHIWANDDDDDAGKSFSGLAMNDDDDDDDEYGSFFGDTEEQKRSSDRVIMPWYDQVDAVIGTFPRVGRNGPLDAKNNIKSRLNGLRWLSTFGKDLPVGVERILVLDATDLESLPLTNDDPNLPDGVNVEEFWSAEGRKPTRVLLRRGRSTQAEGAARAAAAAAEAASKAAMAAMMAVETGDAESAAEAAMEYQNAALAATEMIQKELSKTLERKEKLQSYGVVVETLNGRDPIDVMEHLGKRNGYGSVVWRAGCWGQRGVQSILTGAFQCVSAHLAVDANGGKFWQQMLAERAVQGACGPESRVKVFSSDDDISLEFCDSNDADYACILTKEGKPVRHVRLDCRVALHDKDRPREFVLAPTKRLDKKVIQEEAPWFL